MLVGCERHVRGMVAPVPLRLRIQGWLRLGALFFQGEQLLYIDLVDDQTNGRPNQ